MARLLDLDMISPIYQVPRDDLVRQVLVPAFSCCVSVKCMVGYFDSTSFRTLAPGIAAFVNQTDGEMRLLASPYIGPDDQQAIRDAVLAPNDVIERVTIGIFTEAKISEDALVRHHYECFAFLIAQGRLKVRLVSMRGTGMFHSKIWMFHDGYNSVCVHGSSNATTPGLLYNFETVRVERPWRSADSEETVKAFEDTFERVWDGRDSDTWVFDLPEAVRLDLMRYGEAILPPTTDQFEAAWRGAEAATMGDGNAQINTVTNPRLTIPEGLVWEHGAFAHQGSAVHAWERAGGRGVLAMATGAGKTITALICAARQLQAHTPLLLIISAPYRPLVDQWQADVRAFGIEPLQLTDLSGDERQRLLASAVRALQSGHSDVVVAVVTIDFLNDHRFRRILDAVPRSVRTMLVGDEVHNLGAEGFLRNLPHRFDLRLGLSATPERQYDQEGTEGLFEFFGGDGPVYTFGLREAIRAGCLVPYTYHLHPVSLSDDEAERYERITQQLVRAGFRGDDDGRDAGSSYVLQLLVRRRAVIENAASKIVELRRLLATEGSTNVRHTLIYATDRDPSQLVAVNRLLGEDLNMLFHQLTADETANRSQTEEILNRFAAGDIQVITCKRVLDEGVNIPQVATAYLIASSATRRQWVQRRGRVLRTCRATGKSIAKLHDFIVVPPDLTTPSGRSILRLERARARAFAEDAANAGGIDDPFDVIDGLGNN